MSEKRENSSVQIGFEGNEAFDSAGPSRTVGMENVPGLEKVNLEMGEPVQVQVEENVDLLDETKPTCMEKTLGWQLAELHLDSCLDFHLYFLFDECHLFLWFD